MNATEQQAHRWLIEHGYQASEIRFQSNRSPDFLTTDGLGWEVKRPDYSRAIAFGVRQLKDCTAHGAVSVMIWVGDSFLTVPFAELEIPGRYAEYRLVVPEAGLTYSERVFGYFTIEQRKRLEDYAWEHHQTVTAALRDFVDTLPSAK